MRELERNSTDTTPTLPALAIVGPGRMGRSLARAAAGAGLDATLAGRRDALVVCERSGAALLCVSDDSIETACVRISAAVPPLRFVGHTSGATGLTALEEAGRRGAETFSLHPLQTIPDDAGSLAGAACAVSGSSTPALALARAFAERLGMRPFHVPEHRRAAYHAAASMASNFLVALEESARELMEAAGIDGARQLLAPLVLRTAANWSEHGAGALTGPIARGDERTVERHRKAIAAVRPDLLDMYESLAGRARAIASATPGIATPISGQAAEDSTRDRPAERSREAALDRPAERSREAGNLTAKP